MGGVGRSSVSAPPRITAGVSRTRRRLARRRERRGAVRVAVAQANLDLGAQWRRELYGKNLDVYAQLTREALREPGTALVVWPESAMTFFLETEPLYRTAIARLLAPNGVELLAGGRRAEALPEPRYYNSAFLLSPAGRSSPLRQQRLPLRRYFPLASVDLLRREFAACVSSYPAPTRRRSRPSPARGVVICNEAMFRGW
jgi:apolipoprotein N-acyltransferase